MHSSKTTEIGNWSAQIILKSCESHGGWHQVCKALYIPYSSLKLDHKGLPETYKLILHLTSAHNFTCTVGNKKRHDMCNRVSTNSYFEVYNKVSTNSKSTKNANLSAAATWSRYNKNSEDILYSSLTIGIYSNNFD